jgi:hypothetical protein
MNGAGMREWLDEEKRRSDELDAECVAPLRERLSAEAAEIAREHAARFEPVMAKFRERYARQATDLAALLGIP